MNTKNNREKSITLVIAIVILSLVLFYNSLLIGDLSFPTRTFYDALLGKSDRLHSYILLHLRLPHTLNTFAVGCLLSLSGYMMQIMLANPLADPYTLGTTGGSSLFVLIAMILGLQDFWIVSASFAGSLIALFILFLTTRSLAQTSPSQLLLMGIILAAGWSAILSLLLLYSPAIQTKSILVWLFGDLDSLASPSFALISIAIGFLCCFAFRKQLSLLSQGIILAKTLGLNTEKVRLLVILMSSLLTACAVSLGGMVGFIGLVVPHLARMLTKQHPEFQMILTFFLGGMLLLFADILARSLFAPEQLPIGLITTIMGVPCYIYLSRKAYVGTH